MDLLKETGMTASKLVRAPIEQNHKLGEIHRDKAVDREMYQRLVGKLIYLAHTRSDIVYSVSVISQFMYDPRGVHLQVVYRVLHYLKAYSVKGILFKKGPEIDLAVYTDADFAGSPVDRRSISRYCTFLKGNLICWKSKKQSVVARSSAEAEFKAMTTGACELLWVKIILEDLRI
ncbi:secreted RxLR effector protein 161-like [Coffea arabica]|uniref:Secreted RxLR effector protein 161-like n=1 Tax=Coffea arabica TaxID=13443 RepID=A0ABM4VKB3_COFAR